MRTGYIVKTYGELNKNTIGVLVFNYEFTSRPCEVVNNLIPYIAKKEEYCNILGRWNIKLKNK